MGLFTKHLSKEEEPHTPTPPALTLDDCIYKIFEAYPEDDARIHREFKARFMRGELSNNAKINFVKKFSYSVEIFAKKDKSNQ